MIRTSVVTPATSRTFNIQVYVGKVVVEKLFNVKGRHNAKRIALLLTNYVPVQA